jgi:GT2 family glycosyltransferase
MLALLVLITLAATVSQIVAFSRMWSYVQQELSFKPTRYLPKISVILPCKGLDPGFERNVRKLMEQDYKDACGTPMFEVIFAVAKEDDPAYSALRQIVDEQSSVPAKLVVAGTSEFRAQKINNQLRALEEVSSDSEAYVFVDSDVIARDDFLRYLVAHLDQNDVGVTTGYRFYIPFKGDWPSLIRSLWNRMTAWELADPGYAFAWGGAMAVRRDVFEKAQVQKEWDRAADDDLSLTTAIKRIGLKVRFVPQCLVASHGDATIAEIVEWTNRQLILTKVYYPKLWRRAIGRATVLCVWLVAVLAGLAGGLFLGDHDMLQAALIGLVLLPIELIFLLKAQGMWESVIATNTTNKHSQEISIEHLKNFKPGELAPEAEQQVLEKAFCISLWRFTLALPLAHLILPWLTLYSLLTNRIKWRGITYELRGPSEIVII